MASPLSNAVRLVKPGDVVISLNDIFDRIGDKITPSEREQLLIAILSRRVEQVRPGDLITADLFNQLLAGLSDLTVRVGRLESKVPEGAQPTIASVQAIGSGAIRIGSQVQILGTGFNAPQGNQVYFNAEKAAATAGADSATTLLASVPDSLAVDAFGSSITVTVRNINGNAYKAVTVLPKMPATPTGDIFIKLSDSPAGKLKPGATYKFVFDVSIRSTLPEDFTVSASAGGWGCKVVDPVTGRPGDTAVLKVTNTSSAGETFKLEIQVSIDQTPATTQVTLALRTTSVRNPLDFSRDITLDLKLDGDAPAPEPLVVQFAGIQDTTTGEVPTSSPGSPIPLRAEDGLQRIYSATLIAKGLVASGRPYRWSIEKPPAAEAEWFVSFAFDQKARTVDFGTTGSGEASQELFLALTTRAASVPVWVRIQDTTDAKQTGHVELTFSRAS